MHRNYKTPPIHEAVVEFQFVSSEERDPTIPGKFQLHKLIGDQYQGKPEVHRKYNSSISDNGVSIKKGPELAFLKNNDGKRLVLIGHNTLSIVSLKPYEGWGEFKPRIRNALRAFFDIVKPESVARIGLRYINFVPLTGPDYTLYLNSPPVIIPDLPKVDSFGSVTVHTYEDLVKLKISQATVDNQGTPIAVVVDLDVIWVGIETDVEETIKLVEELHSREVNAFEKLITDYAREVFGGQ